MRTMTMLICGIWGATLLLFPPGHEATRPKNTKSVQNEVDVNGYASDDASLVPWHQAVGDWFKGAWAATLASVHATGKTTAEWWAKLDVEVLKVKASMAQMMLRWWESDLANAKIKQDYLCQVANGPASCNVPDGYEIGGPTDWLKVYADLSRAAGELAEAKRIEAEDLSEKAAKAEAEAERLRTAAIDAQALSEQKFEEKFTLLAAVMGKTNLDPATELDAQRDLNTDREKADPETRKRRWEAKKQKVLDLDAGRVKASETLDNAQAALETAKETQARKAQEAKEAREAARVLLVQQSA